jgi:chromosome segregation ATPase
MAFGRKPGAAAVAAAQAALDDAPARQESIREQIAHRQGQRDELAEDPAGYQQNEATIRELQAEHERLAIVVRRRERDLEEAERLAAHAEWQRSGRELVENGQTPRRRASSRFAAAVAETLAAAADLEQEEAKTKELEARYATLRPSDVDEWAWPGKTETRSSGRGSQTT